MIDDTDLWEDNIYINEFLIIINKDVVTSDGILEAAERVVLFMEEAGGLHVVLEGYVVPPGTRLVTPLPEKLFLIT